MKEKILYALLITSAIFAYGCPPIGPHSRGYKPISEKEEYALSRADRAIFPGDVRENFDSHDSSRVVWPGIIKEADIESLDSLIRVHFLVEHHYYDWIEDFSIQQERIFLSPRGEGLFEFTWDLIPTADTSQIKNSVDDMVITYGIPTVVTDSIIHLWAFHIRVIDKEWFATDIMDYGRPGSEVKLLRVP